LFDNWKPTEVRDYELTGRVEAVGMVETLTKVVTAKEFPDEVGPQVFVQNFTAREHGARRIVGKVEISLSGPLSDEITATTGANGIAEFSFTGPYNRNSGLYIVEVENVVHDDYEYNPDKNVGLAQTFLYF
jgi:hypothetical protein